MAHAALDDGPARRCNPGVNTRRSTPSVRARQALCCACWLVGIVLPAGLNADDSALERLALQRYGASGAGAVREWRSLVATLRGEPESEQLRRVNDYFNRRIRFQDDPVTWQQVDYWATPIESLGRGAGDCEDFTIAKYFTLRELGVPHERLRLIYVRAQIGGPSSSIAQAHMVLGYYPTPAAVPQVLDNLVGEIRPATQRPDLSPVFSFNAEGVYMAQATSSVERISRWKDLAHRMKTEGYLP